MRLRSRFGSDAVSTLTTRARVADYPLLSQRREAVFEVSTRPRPASATLKDLRGKLAPDLAEGRTGLQARRLKADSAT